MENKHMKRCSTISMQIQTTIRYLDGEDGHLLIVASHVKPLYKGTNLIYENSALMT